jgi:hypothetical protein
MALARHYRAVQNATGEIRKGFRRDPAGDRAARFGERSVSPVRMDGQSVMGPDFLGCERPVVEGDLVHQANEGPAEAGVVHLVAGRQGGQPAQDDLTGHRRAAGPIDCDDWTEPSRYSSMRSPVTCATRWCQWYGT